MNHIHIASRAVLATLAISAAGSSALALEAPVSDAPAAVVGVMSSSPVMQNVAAMPATPAPGAISALVLGDPSGLAAEAGRLGSASTAVEDISWLLGAEQRPWPLRYQPLSMTGSLYLSLPSEQEARLMLPGMAMDSASRARQQVTKYVTDIIGVAVQDRTRQLDLVKSWVERSDKQKASLGTNDEWLEYAFSSEIHKEAAPYRERLALQSEAQLKEVVGELSRVVGLVTPVMNSMQGYEQRTAWYGVMVQFKEGLQLVQAQQRTGDAQVLKVLDDFIQSNPPIARPQGDAPRRTASGGRQMPKVELQPSTVEVIAPRVAAVAPQPETEKEGGSSFLGTIIGLGMVAGVIGFFVIPLRRRMKKTKPQANT